MNKDTMYKWLLFIWLSVGVQIVSIYCVILCVFSIPFVPESLKLPLAMGGLGFTFFGICASFLIGKLTDQAAGVDLPIKTVGWK